MLDTLFDQEYAVEAYGNEEREEGRREGREEGVLSTLKSMMKSLGLTAEKALSASGIPEDKWKDYLPQLV